MILLSFDIEEFDLPRESGVNISLEEAMPVSDKGTNIILDILKEEKVKGTFFCTTTFAQHAPETVKRILNEGHELASHGCDHWDPKPEDVIHSKKILEEQTGVVIRGYRQPRMFPVSKEELQRQGYLYNSSLHPTCIPGRYNHLDMPRVPFKEGNLLEIPMSVSPWVRLPLFWLACHNYPFGLYKRLCRWTHNHDGQFVIYFHPWEFYELNEHPEWKIPYIIRHHSGEGMRSRLRGLIETFKEDKAEFVTFTEFIKRKF